MPPAPVLVVMSELQKSIMVRLSRARSRPARVVERSKMLILALEGLSDAEIGRRLDMNAQRPRRWRRRWRALRPQLDEAETAGVAERQLEDLIVDGLADRGRSGTPPTFSAEQVAQLIALACEPPRDSQRPTTHWTPTELAQEAVKRGIVESISPRHLDRLLKRGGSATTQEPLLDDVQGQAG
ncbi:MAG: helix-turn-helix domain-containing protein [Myxococcota bacterium]